MPDRKPKTASARKKKAARKPTPRNRYHRRAKLSEYKFLQVLRGFADDRTVSETAAETRISTKTVRALYKGFRERLVAAAISEPFAFGGAGRFLLDRDKLGDRGRRFLGELAKSPMFDQHLNRHAPRIGGKVHARDELFECAVRAFCVLAMRDKPEDFYPPETKAALETFHEIAAWISQNRDQAGFLEERANLISRFGKIMEQMPRLLEKEDLLALRNNAAPHRYPGDVLYEHLRRYLLKDPL